MPCLAGAWETSQTHPDIVRVCCAVALTVYFAAQYMVLNYVRKLSSVGHWWSPPEAALVCQCG